MHKYYAILGLKYGASVTDIKKAYYKLSKEIHPDINSSESAIEEFVRINEAYEILLKIRKLPYKVSLKKRKKKVNKEWLLKEKRKAKFEAVRKLKLEREEYLRSIRKETYSKDIWKIFKAYILTLFFFSIILITSYAARVDDKTFPLERLHLFLISIAIVTTIVYTFVAFIFRSYYKDN